MAAISRSAGGHVHLPIDLLQESEHETDNDYILYNIPINIYEVNSNGNRKGFYEKKNGLG